MIAAVIIGQVEGRPMPAAKLAEYAGMARPSAARRLRELQSSGIVTALDGGQYVLTDAFMANQEAAQALNEAAARVIA